MNKLFLFALIFVSQVAFAQMKKGKILVGGSIKFYDFNTESHNSPAANTISKSNEISINPLLGLFLSDRSVVGIEPGYSYMKNEYSSAGTPGGSAKQSTFSIKPFYRYYFPLGEKVAFFLQGSAGISLGKDNQKYLYLDERTGLVTTAHQKSDFTSLQASINPGFAFFITPKWSLDASISTLEYTHIKQKQGSGEYSADTNRMSFDYNVFRFGVTAYLGKQ